MPMPIAPFNLTLYGQLKLNGGCRASTLIKRLVHRVSLHFLGNACETVPRISSLLQVNTQMVFKWRKRYSVHDFKGFYDSPRLSQHRKLNRGDVKIYEHTVHQVPIQALHWICRTMRWSSLLMKRPKFRRSIEHTQIYSSSQAKLSVILTITSNIARQAFTRTSTF